MQTESDPETAWNAELPEDLRNNPALKDFTGVEALAQSFVDTKAMVGSSMRIPGENAGAEDWNTFNTKLMEKVPGLVKMPADDDTDGLNALWSKLGRPQTAEGYQAPEGVDDASKYIETAKKLGLTANQFKDFVVYETTKESEEYEAQKAAQKASQSEVLGEWGAAKEQKLRQIRTMLEATDAPEAIKNVVSDMNVDGNFLRWAETIVTSMGTEGAHFRKDGNNAPPTVAVTPHEANIQISEIMGNPQHAYHNKHDPGHKMAVQRVIDLHDYRAGREPQNKI